jgi:hypothetical protein
VAHPLLSRADSSADSRSVLVPIAPARLLDTRPGSNTVDGQFQGGGHLGAEQTLALAVGGRAGIPADPTAVVLDVTALDPNEATFLTVWPAGQPQPLASNLNPTPGQPPTPNLVTVGLGSGVVNVFNLAGEVDVVADVTGYYTAADYGPRPGPLGLIGWAAIGVNSITNQYTSTGAPITLTRIFVSPFNAEVYHVVFPGFASADQRSNVQVTPLSPFRCIGRRGQQGADLFVDVSCLNDAGSPVLVDAPFSILVLA